MFFYFYKHIIVFIYYLFIYFNYFLHIYKEDIIAPQPETPSAPIVYTTVTLSTAFDTMLLYNSTQSNKAVAVYTFGSQTITAGNFTLTMPSNTTSTALVRLSTT